MRILPLLLRGGFKPNDLPNLAAWFRYGLGITSAAGAVSQWDDASLNVRHLKQATGAAQPALQADGSILFDGTSDFLKCDAFTLVQPETVYFLGRQVTWTLNDYLYDGNTANTGAIIQYSASPNILLGAATSTAENTDLAVNTYGVVTAVLNGANSLVQVNNGTAATGDIGTRDLAGFTLGASGGGTAFGNIQVKEVIVFSAAHDATTRARVIAYLSRVGGL